MKLYALALHNHKRAFFSIEDLLEYLKTNRHLSVCDVSESDRYVAASDIGYPFEYFKKGETHTLSEWVVLARKECSRMTADKSDADIVATIIEKDYFWNKVSPSLDGE